MKKIIIMLLITSSATAESFIADRPKRQKRESKQELMEEIGGIHAHLPKEIADMLNDLADVQKEATRLQKSSIDTALDVVAGDYCPKASKEELALKRDEAKKIKAEIQRIKEGAASLKRELKKVNS